MKPRHWYNRFNEDLRKNRVYCPYCREEITKLDFHNRVQHKLNNHGGTMQ
jgi:hypothetical protein